MLAFKNLEAIGAMDTCKYKQYAEVLNKFLVNEIARIISMDKCIDIFRDFQASQDDFDLLNAQMNNYIQFKFNLLKLQGIMNRLNLIVRTQFIRGPQYILCIMHRIKIQRQIYVLQIEQGLEVRIPLSLSQENLPYSFRYYDSLIHSIQKQFNFEKGHLMKLRMSLIQEFDKQYSLQVFLGFNKNQRERLAIESQKNPSVKTNIDYNISLHARTRQRSNYVRVDDNPINFNFQKNIFSALYDDEQLSDEKIMQMKEELNRIHIKFSGEDHAHKRRKQLLQSYHIFLQQLTNLRNKNIRFGLSQKVDHLVESHYKVNSFEDYQNKKYYTQYAIKQVVTKQIKQDDADRADHLDILKNITSIQGKQKYIEMQIENIIRYYNPKYNSSLKEHLKLKRKLRRNETLLRQRGKNTPTRKGFVQSGLQNIMLKSAATIKTDEINIKSAPSVSRTEGEVLALAQQVNSRSNSRPGSTIPDEPLYDMTSKAIQRLY